VQNQRLDLAFVGPVGTFLLGMEVKERPIPEPLCVKGYMNASE